MTDQSPGTISVPTSSQAANSQVAATPVSAPVGTGPLLSGAVNPDVTAHPHNTPLQGTLIVLESLARQLESAIGEEAHEVTIHIKAAVDKIKVKLKI